MLVRDKVIDNKELNNSNEIKKSNNTSELLFEKKKHLFDKVESIIQNTSNKNEKQLLNDTADVIEILISNIRKQNILESDLVNLIEQKNKIFGSYNEGYMKPEEKMEDIKKPE